MARTVQSPDGTRWKVGREWAPWRPRLRSRHSDRAEEGTVEGSRWSLEALGAADDLLAGVAIALTVGLLVFLAFVVVWPVVAIAIEIALIVIGVVVATLGRIVLRRPWVVRAREVGGGHGHAWRVAGWRTSRDLIEAVSSSLERGLPLPPPR